MRIVDRQTASVPYGANLSFVSILKDRTVGKGKRGTGGTDIVGFAEMRSGLSNFSQNLGLAERNGPGARCSLSAALHKTVSSVYVVSL